MFFGIDLIQAIQAIGYPGIFAIVLAESGLFFAVTLPGGSMLFTAGLLASQGILNIWILFVTVVVAAALGDTIGYWFGAWVGPALYRRKDSRFFKRKHLEQTKVFFEEHGSKAIFLGRFVPIVRTFIPILAGVANMKYGVFLFYNLAGAVLWGGGFTLAGYFLGEAIPDVEKYIEVIVLAIVVITVLPLAHQVWRARKLKAAAPALARPAAIIFDLDDTLADSFQPPAAEILEKIFRLAERMPVAIMSGASFTRIERDILKRVPHQADASNLYVLSDNAARCDVWKGTEWETAYGFPLEQHERELITRAINETVDETSVFAEDGLVPRIIDRDTSVALAALPADASRAEKQAWDTDMKKRPVLANALREKLPGYEVLIGGKTTIDIVRKGVSKAFGVEWLAKELNIPTSEMLFVGDAFYEGGNDAVVIPTGIQTYTTSGPEETEKLIDETLAA
ncbi:MAG: HAD-IIB family hydrolase [Patescibacteria group bacterium]